ncbi:hypothetical protein PSQ19_02560 [Devosia algicola]|uniref:Uncharacterized protein n=1 Tax=Devosia algicola TaxID=3026418 RepID=A0ABY7YPM6_9HYPH|nr:hypothetical protein [Devosia algicola]WDR03103.1 hypothetical protein PSQ19_02560 [Devosia algicola]
MATHKRTVRSVFVPLSARCAEKSFSGQNSIEKSGNAPSNAKTSCLEAQPRLAPDRDNWTSRIDGTRFWSSIWGVTSVRIAIIAALMMLAPSAASAACFQTVGYDTTSFINGAVDYLVCLHNQQNDALEEHTRALNRQIDTSNQHADLINQNAQRISDLERQNQLLQMQLDALTGLVNAIDGRINAQ